LDKLVLGRLCDRARSDIRGLGVLGLGLMAEDSSNSTDTDHSLTILTAQLFKVATEVAATTNMAGRQGLVRPYLDTLRSIVEASQTGLHKTIGTSGVLQLALAATIGASWVAESTCAGIVSESSKGKSTAKNLGKFDKEEQKAMQEALDAIWRALAQRNNKHCMHPKQLLNGDDLVLRRRLECAYKAIVAPPPPVPPATLQSLETFLPGRVCRNMSSVVTLQQPKCLEDQDQDQKSPRMLDGILGTFQKTLECLTWTMLIMGAAIAISEDGLGILKFHTLPTFWQPSFRRALMQKAARVEELLARQMSEDSASSNGGDDNQLIATN